MWLISSANRLLTSSCIICLAKWSCIYSADATDRIVVSHIFRGKDEGDNDIQDLVMSFSGLEEQVLEQYTFAKV